ncbi:hypothetical protein EsH8_III_000149 [Colletotrichum jinshuiense]
MPPTGLGSATEAILSLRSSTPDAAAAVATAATNTTTPPWLVLPEPDPNEWNGATVVPVAVISALVASAFVAMRFYTRARILHAVKWEDWTILASLVFAIATSAGMMTQLKFGLGDHLYFVWPTFSTYVMTGTFTNLFYSISLTLTKVSILLLYVRILTYDLVRRLGKTLLGIVVITHTWIIVSILTTCIPLHAAWDRDPLNPPMYCHPINVFWGNACMHLATDFLIFLLPLFVVSSMRLPRRQKMGLYFVFCLAFLVCGISIIRLVGFFHTNESPAQVMDVTWTAVRVANWTCIEVNAAIVTACLTTLKPLLARLFPSLMASATPSSSRSSSSSSPSSSAGSARKDWEENYSNGDAEVYYKRPLTIGTMPNRLRPQRDTFASIDDIKWSPTEHEEEVDAPAADAANSGRGGGDGANRDDFRLAEVDAGAPLRWPSLLVRKSTVQVPQGAVTRGSPLRHVQSHQSPVPGNMS